ncbi:MAG: DUF4249 family protein [Bacteroidales bacterium]|nr:DUF4249 family protein [Bacteroidales bacterium]
MKSRCILCMLLLALLCPSCEKVLDVDFEPSQRILVLNGVPSADRQLFVNFSYSRFFLDTRISHPVSGASVSVSVNGVSLSPSAVEGSNYFFPYTLREDDSIRVTAVADGHTLMAGTYVPRMPKISNLVSFMDTTYSLRFGSVSFDLADHPDYPDRYRFVITSRDSGMRYNAYEERYDTIDTVRTHMFLCNDVLLSDASATEPLAGYFYSELLTSDSLFDGQTRHVTLLMLHTIDTNEVPPFLHQYTLDVETVTLDRYRYLTDLATSSSLLSAFTEPAPVHTNIQGGYGIFAGNARRVYPLDFSLPAE